MKTKYEVFEQAIESIHSLSEPDYAPLGHSEEELKEVLQSIAKKVGEALPAVSVAPDLLELAIEYLGHIYDTGMACDSDPPCACPECRCKAVIAIAEGRG